jgi:hypothetical protein
MINHVTLLQPSGLMVAHSSFKKINVDEIKISGFMAAILAFSQDLGKLTTMKLGDVNYWFDTISSLVIVVAANPNVNTATLSNFFIKLKECIEFKECAELVTQKSTVDMDSDEIQTLLKIIQETTTALGLIQQVEFIPGLTSADARQLKEIIDELQEGKTSPKEHAQKIFGEGFESSDPGFITKYIDILEKAIEANQIHKALKAQLEQLLKFLQHTFKGATDFGFFEKKQLNIAKLKKVQNSL